MTINRLRTPKPGSTRHELKRRLQENRLSPDETRSLFAPVVSALLKLKNDAELFRAYSNYLSDKMESLWSDEDDDQNPEEHVEDTAGV